MTTSAGYGVAIAPETTTWNTKPSGGYSWEFLPVEPTSGVPVVDNIFDEARRGLAAIGFNQLAGVERTEMSLSGPVYPEQIGWLLKSIFGTVDSSGTADPYEHVFDATSMADADGYSLAVQIDDDVGQFTHTGCMVTGLTFRFNAAEGLVTCETSLIGYGMGTAEAAHATAEDTTYNDPFRGWQADVTTSSGLGTSSTGRLIEGEIAIARDADLLYVANNSVNPVRLIPGLIAVTGRFTASFDAVADLTLYTTTAPQAMAMRFLQGTTPERGLAFEFPKLSYRESPAEVDRSGNNMTIGYNIRGLIATTTEGWGSAERSTNLRVQVQSGHDDSGYDHPTT